MDSTHYVSGRSLDVEDVALILVDFVLFAGATALFTTACVLVPAPIFGGLACGDVGLAQTENFVAFSFSALSSRRLSTSRPCTHRPRLTPTATLPKLLFRAAMIAMLFVLLLVTLFAFMLVATATTIIRVGLEVRLAALVALVAVFVGLFLRPIDGAIHRS